MTDESDPAKLEMSVVDRILNVTVQGQVNAGQVRILRERLQEHPAFAGATGVLVDFRGADLTRVSADDVREIAANEVLLARDQKLAIVVSGSFGYGLGRMFEQLRAGRSTVRVFRSPLEANAWLADRDSSAPVA